MNRRSFLALTATSVLATSTLNAGEGTEEYTPGLINQKLSDGETVLVDFAASWCSTCKRQERVIEELRAENPEFNQAISFVKVDWDKYSSHEITQSRNVPRRSTLLLLKGDQELGRIVAGTNPEQIKALLEIALTS